MFYFIFILFALGEAQIIMRKLENNNHFEKV